MTTHSAAPSPVISNGLLIAAKTTNANDLAPAEQGLRPPHAVAASAAAPHARANGLEAAKTATKSKTKNARRDDLDDEANEDIVVAEGKPELEQQPNPPSSSDSSGTPATANGDAHTMAPASTTETTQSGGLLAASPSWFGVLLSGGAVAAAASSSSGTKASASAATTKGYLIDSPVGGVDYYINGVLKGKTAADGSFAYAAGDTVTFKVGNITLGQLSPNSDGKVYVQDLAGVERSNLTDRKMVKIAQLLQSLDADGNPANGIEVDTDKVANIAEQPITETTDLVQLVKPGVVIVSESAAVAHIKTGNPSALALESTTPTATLSVASSLLKAGDSTTVTLRFSEAIQLWGDIKDMLSADNGTLGSFSSSDGGLTYTGLYTAGTASTAQIRFSGNYSDLNGNIGAAASSSVSIDATRPTLTITDSQTTGAATGPVTYTFTFSEAVNDFSADDITVANGSKGTLVASTVAGEEGKVFTMEVTPTSGAQGTDIGLSVGKAWSDAAGNAPASTTNAPAQAYDTLAPKVNLMTPPLMTQLTPKNTRSVYNEKAQISAVGSSGEFVVTWQGFDSDNDFSIFVQKFNADGTTLGSMVQLEALNNNLKIDQSPQITAVGSTGEFVVSWQGQDSLSDHSIFVQKFNADGTIQSDMVQLEALNNSVGSDYKPQIAAVGISGEFVVIWEGQDSSSERSIFVQKFKADGTIQGNMVQLEALNNSSGDDKYPQITALGSTGEFVVTWRGKDSQNDFSIFVQKFNADGTNQGNMVQLEALNNSTAEDSVPQITTVGSNGEFVVTWQGQDSQDDFSIFVQKFNADGTTQGNMVQLEALNKSNGHDYDPQITAVGSSGEFVVTWYGQDSQGDNSIFVQKFNADGTLQSDTVQLEALNNSFGEDTNPQITALGNSGEFVVTWQGQEIPSATSIFVQKFSADGATQGNMVKLESINGSSQNYSPQISAVGNAGEFAVTWQGTDSHLRFNIFVQKFNADGSLATQAVTGPAGQVTVPIKSSELGTAYLVHDSIDLSALGLGALTDSNDGQWNSLVIGQANTLVDISTAGLDAGTYNLYTADEAGNLAKALAVYQASVII
jgi:hypothetical protein